MASRQPERCIPHVQEVFGNRSWLPTEKSELSSIDHPANLVAAEKELKHIEKRMSMKKTIRKQISRQLAQAFVENPELSREDGRPRLDCNRNNRNAHNLTLTKCKMLAKMDGNVLDLLRRAEEVAPALDQPLPVGNATPASSNNDFSKHEASSKKPSLWKRLWSSKR